MKDPFGALAGFFVPGLDVAIDEALAVLEFAVMGVFMPVATHTADRFGIKALEIGRVSAPMARAAGGLGVFAGENEFGPPVVVKNLRLPARGRMAKLALGRLAKLLEPAFVAIVVGMTDLARFIGPPLAQFFGVAFVTTQLVVGPGQVEAGPFGVGKAHCGQRTEFGRMAPGAVFLVE